MTIPSHVIGMLDKRRARFQAEPLAERMLPSDSGLHDAAAGAQGDRASVDSVLVSGCRTRP
jgi:hypothetical protein